MMETKFTHYRLFARLFSVLLICSLGATESSAQCACKESVQVSINETGTATVTAAMLLADGASTNCAGAADATVTVMLTPTGSPISGSPVINCDYIGKTLYGKVTNGAGTNSCWSKLIIEDKVKPIITCPADLTLTCLEMGKFAPTVTDNCGKFTVSVVSETVKVNDCKSGLDETILKTITRQYQAVDPSGNKSAICTMNFSVTIIDDLGDIDFPDALTINDGNALACDGDWAKLDNGNPSPVKIGTKLGVGVPALDDTDLYPNPNLSCNIVVSYNDVKLPRILFNGKTTGCVTKIMRTWNVIEWSCADRILPPVVQMIEIVDSEGPAISGLKNLAFSTSNHSCEGNVTFTNPTLKDNCDVDANLTVDITVYPNGGAEPGLFIKSGSAKTASLPVGTHTVVYTAYDGCYNSTTASIVVEVADNTAPVAICDEFATIGLTSDGTAWIPASVFDDGSYDECELSKMLVRRMNNTTCTTCEIPVFVGFTYLDTATVDKVLTYRYESQHVASYATATKTAVAMGGKITSAAYVGDAKYTFALTDICGWSSYAKFCCSDVGTNQTVGFRVIDKSGNFNDCMVSAVIQDKIGPAITCPADMTVACTFAYEPLNLRKDFGWPTATDNCNDMVITEIDSTNSITSCRTGVITRTFQVTDKGGRTASCTQTITFQNAPSELYNGPTAAEWPKDVTINGCGSLTDPNLLPAVLGSPMLSDGVCSLVGAEYRDEIYSFNNPSSPACFKILRYWTVIDWCQPDLVNGGYIKFPHLQEIKVIDNVAPVFATLAPAVSANTTDATCAAGTITLTASATDNCTTTLNNSYRIDAGNDGSFSAAVKNTGNTISITGSFPVGTHKIVYTFEDKCGNVTSREQLFSIVNIKAPNAYVKDGLAISLMNLGNGVGMAEIWASDFDNGSNHSCGYPVLLSFSSVTVDALGQLVGTPNLTYSCADRGAKTVTIYVAALTPAGTVVQSSVTTHINIQDNNTPKICSALRLSVNGTLATEAKQTVEDVYVSLLGSEMSDLTSAAGTFQFGNIDAAGQYQVSPSKNDDHLNGISTLDLVMIQRHILGLDMLNSPYKLIAADVTKDGKISAADLVELRKLVLGTTAQFANNKSWRFVDGNYTFQDASNAQGEAFPETYSISNMSSDMVTDFVAVKIGDVNGNVKASKVSNTVEPRSNDKLVLTTENVSFRKGDKVTVPVQVAQSTELSGLQFTLNFDGDMLALQNIEGSALDVTDSNFGFAAVNEGLVTASWNDAMAKSVSSGNTLFEVSFIAQADGNIENALNISSDITRAEAYSADADVMDVQWSVSSRIATTEYILYQNAPNPFKESTMISFDLPKDMTASLTVFDVTGKVLKTTSVNGVKGYNTVELHKNEINAGIMYYTLKAGEFTATKKMVVIE